MVRYARLFAATPFALALAATTPFLVLVVAACAEDPVSPTCSTPSCIDGSTSDSGTADAQTQDGSADGGTSDGGTSDGGTADAAVQDSGAGGPVMAIQSHSVWFRIQQGAILGTPFADDTLLTVPEAPDCVAFLRSSAKPNADIGTVKVSTSLSTANGGPTSQISIDADSTLGTINEYASFLTEPEVLFKFGAASQLQFESSGDNDGFGLLNVQTLTSSPYPKLTVTNPTIVESDAGAADLSLSVSKDFDVTWTVPSVDAGSTAAKVTVSLWGIATSKHQGAIHCRALVSAGALKVPSRLMKELYTRMGSPKEIGAVTLDVFAGDRTIVTKNDTVFVIDVGTIGTTSLGYKEEGSQTGGESDSVTLLP